MRRDGDWRFFRLWLLLLDFDLLDFYLFEDGRLRLVQSAIVLLQHEGCFQQPR